MSWTWTPLTWPEAVMGLGGFFFLAVVVWIFRPR